MGKLGYDFGSQAVGEVAGGLGGEGFEVDFEVVDFYGWHFFCSRFYGIWSSKAKYSRIADRANMLAILMWILIKSSA